MLKDLLELGGGSVLPFFTEWALDPLPILEGHLRVKEQHIHGKKSYIRDPSTQEKAHRKWRKKKKSITQASRKKNRS